jgi:hypothetical protein
MKLSRYGWVRPVLFGFSVVETANLDGWQAALCALLVFVCWIWSDIVWYNRGWIVVKS